MSDTPKLALDVTVYDGKYTVQMTEKGRLTALRYGEPWRDLLGDGLVCALAGEVESLRNELTALRRDKERLDWLGKNCTRIADSERYLATSVYWGKGTHKDIRAAVDAAMEAKQ
jgi:hypothetical protein